MITAPSLKTILFGAGGILTIWLAVAPDLGAREPKRPIVAEPSLPINATIEEGPTVRTDSISQRTAVAVLRPSNRNPFRYGSRRSPLPLKRTRQDPRLANSAERSTVTAASPMLTLSGIARKGRRHTAIIVSGAEIHLVSEGETFMGGYTVVDIDSDGVLIRDASGVERRLTFR